MRSCCNAKSLLRCGELEVPITISTATTKIHIDRACRFHRNPRTAGLSGPTSRAEKASWHAGVHLSDRPGRTIEWEPPQPGCVIPTGAFCCIKRPKHDEPWTGMTIFGNRRPCIGSLPKRPKIPSLSKNSSTWQLYAKRLPIRSKIVGQAGNDLRTGHRIAVVSIRWSCEHAVRRRDAAERIGGCADCVSHASPAGEETWSIRCIVADRRGRNAERGLHDK